MLQGKRIRKVVAATFLTILVTNTFAPGISYALTSGPTQPEATSFEPIDTTDMVNLATGGLAYSIPLIEVPGPEGNYPLALSYHAGIQPNEDASWVGLGWNLNPGAVSRNVNGYPDEWFGVNNTSHVYWSGGKTSTFSIGVSLPVAGAAGVSFGLSFSQDTYRGFDVGFSEGVYAGLGNSPFSVNATVGVSPYGESFASVGIGVSGTSGKDGGLSGSLGVNFTTNFNGSNTVGFSAGVGYSVAQHDDAKDAAKVTGHTNYSLLGASISTGGGKPELSIGGLSAHVSSTNVAQISTSSSGFSTAGLGLPISLGWSKTRYYIDQLSNIKTFGSLSSYGWAINGDKSLPDDVAFDTYALQEDPADKNMVDYPDPTVLQGGSFDDYDQYLVVAQGIGGSIRPYKQMGQGRGQNRKNDDGSYRVKYFSPARPGFLGGDDMMPQFRFVNDFSNSYRQNYNSYASSDLNNNLLPSLTLPFDPNPAYGYLDPDYPDTGPDYAYDANENILSGSRSVTVGTDILPSGCLGFTPAANAQGTIIGFTITNESGVRYVFGLPAYSSGEEVYQEKIDRSHGLSFNRQHKNTPYAYTWYLTSIIGPDFVDRNHNSVADDGDWGYWVNFEYGKWSGNYIWRNPSEGYNVDEDNGWKNCSEGYKEVYYLNAIRTRSHVALFEKDVRVDGKGESGDVFAKTSQGDYYLPGEFSTDISGTSMKLSHVYLLNASDENYVTPSSGTQNGYVLDASDVDAVGRANLESRSLRVLDFNYDYSLCAHTANSFTTYGQTQGKLTLLSLSTRGKGGALIMPPNQFQYELGADAISQSGVTLSPGTFVTTNPNFQVGDMIKCTSPDVYCGVITGVSSSSGSYTYTLANSNYTGGAITATVSTTKNPPYNKDFYDIWGMYKSDANMTLIGQKASAYRKTTNTSSRGVDAWSMRKVVSPLGGTINIGYESNTMRGSAINNDLPISTVTGSLASESGSGNPVVQLHFKINSDQPDYTFFNSPKTGDKGVIAVQGTIQVVSGFPPFPHPKPVATSNIPFTVTAVDGDGTIHVSLQTSLDAATSWTDAILFFDNIVNYYVGGGPRIKSIMAQSDISSEIFTTSYQYTIPGTSRSSGVTSYFPVGLDVVPAPLQLAYLNVMSSVYALARELPPPGVMYEYVSVSKQVQQPDDPAKRTIPGSTLYQYEVFRPNMVGRIEVAQRQTGTYNSNTQYARYYAIDKFTGGIGNVRRVTQFDDHGNKLQELINNYLHDNLVNEDLTHFMADYKVLLQKYHYQGYIQERSAEVKQVNNQDVVASDPNTPHDVSYKATISGREEYPCIQTGQTVINYVNGTRTVSQNLAFDYYSGAVTQTLETDAYGNNVLTKTIPAYRKYSTMGIRNGDGNSVHVHYPNMLSQTTATYSYKADANGTPLGLIGASVTTWSDLVPVMGTDGTMYTQNGADGDVFRQQATYNWMPPGQTSDGITPMTGFTGADFNWSNPSTSDARWTKVSEITLYDVFSKGLEAKDINSNYTATHLNYTNKKVILTGSPGNFYEMAYSGAEDGAINQTANIFVKASDGTTSTMAAHTGAQSLLLGTSGKKGFLYTVPVVGSGSGGVLAGRSYTANVWVKPAAGTASDVKLYYSVNGTVRTPSASSGAGTKTAGGWTLINLAINGSDLTAGTTLNVWCQNDHATVQAYVDDMRFQPMNANTVAYVYDPFSGELTHILDNSNLYTRFSYDASGRLIGTYREKLNNGSFTAGEFKSNQYQYNYSTTRNPSNAVNGQYQKNTCPLGQGLVGSMVDVSLPQGAYSSYLSVQDATAAAGIYAQDYANTHGTCICSPTLNYQTSVSDGQFYFQQNGTVMSFTFEFTNTNGYSNFYLGNITGSCAFPTATRTIPVSYGGANYNVTIDPIGLVNVQWVSGTYPTAGMDQVVYGEYDINQDLIYSPALSGTFYKSCTAPQVGTGIPYSIPANMFWGTDFNDVINRAEAFFNTNGQANANSQGQCVTPCDFTPDPSANIYYSVTSSGNTVSFTFGLNGTESGYYGGTLGTISGCVPPTDQMFYIQDSYNPNRYWTLIIRHSGVVSVSSNGIPLMEDDNGPLLSGTFSM